MIERKSRSFIARASFDLDERKSPAAPGHDIDLSARHPRPSREDAPAFKAQIPAGQGFGSSASLLGGLSIQRGRSSARL